LWQFENASGGVRDERNGISECRSLQIKNCLKLMADDSKLIAPQLKSEINKSDIRNHFYVQKPFQNCLAEYPQKQVV
jgi:hypothetical protein